MKRGKLIVKGFILVLVLIMILPSISFAFLIPDTGQTQCYDNNNETDCPYPGESLYGQDGNYLINPPSYTKLDAMGHDLADDATTWVMVRDNITGLIWEVKNSRDGVTNFSNQNDADNKYTWCNNDSETNGGNQGNCNNGQDTEDFINWLNFINFGGYSDWRLPTMVELTTIIDYGRYEPAIKIDSFPSTATSAPYYWTSITSADGPSLAWRITFYNGYAQTEAKSEAHYVRAVRGGYSFPENRFLDNQDGTVTDNFYGYIWQQQSSINSSWENALSYCENLALGNANDWRLPNIKELLSLVDWKSTRPTIDTNFFPNTSLSHYISSTTNVEHPNNSWTVNFNDVIAGINDLNQKSDTYPVRCVRKYSSPNRYILTDLGTLDVNAINASGQIVGQISHQVPHAFLWDDGVLTDLGTNGGLQSTAQGINDSGQIVGDIYLASNQRIAFLWEDGQFLDLGGLAEPSALYTRYAYDINNNGQIVGYSDIPPDSHAFLWLSGIMYDLGTLREGGGNSSANAINNSGQIVGETSTNYGQSAFLWENGIMTDLNNLAGKFEVSYTSQALDINDLGQIIGNSEFMSGSNNTHAFLWKNGVMTDLGTLGNIPTYRSSANAINNNGQVVGSTDATDLGYRACLWENGVIKNINELLFMDYGNWNLKSIEDINDIGQMVGWGTLDGQSRSFLLTPAIKDIDKDSVANESDNCPTIPNPDQNDTDEDFWGDACDGCPSDSSKTAPGICGCGIPDNYPDCSCVNPNLDTDFDGIFDCVDNCINDPLNDIDDDGVCGNLDNCPEISNTTQQDYDNDNIGDSCDPDIDNDGIPNQLDQCPTTSYQMAIYSNGCKAQDLYNQIDQLTNQVSSMYTQEELDQVVETQQSICSNFDVTGDNQIGLEEAIRALQITSGQRPQP